MIYKSILNSIPSKPCARPSCPNLSSLGKPYCSKCEQAKVKQYDRSRNKEWQHLYGSRWQKARKGFLAQHPLCVECLKNGITKGANVVDHHIPHKGNIKKFWDVSNWQSLCVRCHNKKTATEGAFGK